ncbi:MAG: PAS domain-containing protein [Deltaproteobacteria bacterium]|nr:PAS domain-containing protein [Deltaproteobacteria bacterium]
MHGHISKVPLWVLLPLAVAFTLLFGPPDTAAHHDAPQQRHVLLLHSYHKGMTWVDDITTSLTATLVKSYPDIEFHIEHMDTKRVIGEEHLRNLFTEYRYKFSRQRFAVVVVADDAALRFALKHHDDLFHGAPVVFCGINNPEPGMNNRPLFTGIMEWLDVKETLRVALALHPDARHVYIINDMSASGRGLHSIIASALPSFADRASFTFLEDYTVAELAALVARLPADSIVLRSAFFVDKKGRTLPNEQLSYNAIDRHAVVPVYSLWDFYMGLGVVGGKMISGTAQGEHAARLAARILNGEKPSEIPIVMQSPNRLIFDYRQLQRFGVKRSALPPGSALINEPRPFYAINKTLTWTAALFTLAMTCISVMLVLNIRRRQLIEEILRESRERLAVTLASIGDGVITFDTEGRAVMLNGVAEWLCGWSQAEASGRLLEEVFPIINEKSGLPQDNPVSRVLASGSIVELANNTILVARDGERRVIADSAAPIRDRGGNVIGVVLVFRDLTEKRAIEEELFKARKLESLGVLAGGIAHDFNNLLTGILGNVSLAKMRLPVGEKPHKYLENAEKASMRARELTQQLLTFAKGGAPLRKPISIAQILTDSSALVLRGSNVRCNLEVASDLWPVEADEGQMSQVFNNLIINADQAMSYGGVVTVRAANVFGAIEGKESRCVRISIEDNGVGIPEENLHRIFDPYFTTKPQGSGLGLATVYSIIRRHEGEITVHSKPGEGTSFIIHLPATVAEPPQQPLPLQGPRRGSGRVLVMDDEEIIRNVAAEILLTLGYEPVLCGDGNEALELYRWEAEKGTPFAAVIMDLTIPGGMGGREAAGKLTAMDPAARVIVSSGYSNDPIMGSFREYGFHGAVIKPYHARDLGAALAEVLGTAPARALNDTSVPFAGDKN